MDDTTRHHMRHIFLSPRPNFPLMTAAELLGMTLGELRREVESGTIVAVSTSLGRRVAREELVAAVMQRFEQGVIEEALGEDAARVLPEAIRLVELRARVPWYQREMLHYFARQEGRSVDDVLTRELEDMACANAEELRAGVPGFGEALRWPGGASEGG